MIKKWATVIHWCNGQAILQYVSNFGCDACSISTFSSCGSFIFSKIKPKTKYQLKLKISQPLIVGQKIELGIHEATLLNSAILVYFTPLLGLFTGSGIMQLFFLNQFIIFLGAIIGTSFGFFLAKKISIYFKKKLLCQPIILQIVLPLCELKAKCE